MTEYDLSRTLKGAHRFGLFIAVFAIRHYGGPQGTPDVDCWYFETLGM